MNIHDIIIIGGGPSGACAAILLAMQGLKVLLLEEKQMPRQKLCGEFVTPESFPSLNRLDVMDQMILAGARQIKSLRLSPTSGRLISTSISDLSGGKSWAMSISRARFDQILFDRARQAGATCLEGVAVRRCLYNGDQPEGVEGLDLSSGEAVKFFGKLIVDASGRNSRLMLEPEERKGGKPGNRLYAFKAHLEGVSDIEDQVELYFFPDGYGGLSRVENGLANLCFIVNERTVREAGGDALEIKHRTIMKNRLARRRLAKANVVGKWHTVGPLTFGHRRLSQRGVIAIGDASGMIDPFTGTGIQIALRTGEIAAESIIEEIEKLQESANGNGKQISTNAQLLVNSVIESYTARYENEFGHRMRIAGILRIVAFSPFAANLLARVFVRVPSLARLVLRATRTGPRNN